MAVGPGFLEGGGGEDKGFHFICRLLAEGAQEALQPSAHCLHLVWLGSQAPNKGRWAALASVFGEKWRGDREPMALCGESQVLVSTAQAQSWSIQLHSLWATKAARRVFLIHSRPSTYGHSENPLCSDTNAHRQPSHKLTDVASKKTGCQLNLNFR